MTVSGGSVIRVLLVDDDAQWIAFMRDLLRDQAPPFELTAVNGFEAAVRELDSLAYDVALIDYHLGARKGVELLNTDAMRKADIPAIVLTADQRVDGDAMAAGAVDYLVKSEVTAGILHRAMRYAVERHNASVLLKQRKASLRTLLEESARARQELAHIFNLSPDMLCTASFDGYFTRTNATWQAVLGFTAAELQRRSFLDFIHPDDRAASLAELDKLAQGQTTFGFANRYRTARGDYRWIEWHAKADVDQRIIYCVARDQTERRLLEQQLRQSQKMEAVGRLAGGVAHDFNNILTVITGLAELTAERTAPDDVIHRDAQEILKACQRATGLTRQLLAFSRKQLLTPEVLDLGLVVMKMTAMLGRIIGEDIDLSISCADELGLVSADRGQIEQIVLNVAVNARDAMPAGGKLSIRLANVDLDDSFVSMHPGSSAGPHVVLAMSDTGVGMTDDVRMRLFEPFFTTKEPGKGTGLGLATVYGIVKQSGGYIWVYSEPGGGSTFEIYLPRTDGRPAAVAPALLPAVVGGTETILVVEDQLEVGHVVQITLARHGYRVLQALDPDRAEELVRSHSGPIHLLLTDVVMPRISGRALAEKLMQQRPDLRVLYMSGYTDDDVVRHGVSARDVAFIEKPFNAASLLRMVRSVLDSPKIC